MSIVLSGKDLSLINKTMTKYSKKTNLNIIVEIDHILKRLCITNGHFLIVVEEIIEPINKYDGRYLIKFRDKLSDIGKDDTYVIRLKDDGNKFVGKICNAMIEIEKLIDKRQSYLDWRLLGIDKREPSGIILSGSVGYTSFIMDVFKLYGFDIYDIVNLSKDNDERYSFIKFDANNNLVSLGDINVWAILAPIVR